MKKVYILSILIIFIAGMAVPALDAQSRKRKISPRIQKPDLTASISLSSSKHHNANGQLCYTLTPTITISNQGNAKANDFAWKIEWISGSDNQWRIYSNKDDEDLGPGNKLVLGGTASWNLTWCTGEKDWKASWKVTLDEGNKISEFNEKNNIIEKIFTPPRKIIKRPAMKP